MLHRRNRDAGTTETSVWKLSADERRKPSER